MATLFASELSFSISVAVVKVKLDFLRLSVRGVFLDGRPGVVGFQEVNVCGAAGAPARLTSFFPGFWTQKTQKASGC